MSDDAASHAQCVNFVLSEVVSQAGLRRVHLCAAQLFRVRVLTSRHFHQRRSAQEHFRLAADEDVVDLAGVVALDGVVLEDDNLEEDDLDKPVCEETGLVLITPSS